MKRLWSACFGTRSATQRGTENGTQDGMQWTAVGGAAKLLKSVKSEQNPGEKSILCTGGAQLGANGTNWSGF